MTSTDELLLSKRYARAWVSLFGSQMIENDISNFMAIIQYLTAHPKIEFMLHLSIIEDDVKYQALRMLGELYILPVGYEQLCFMLIKHKRSFLLGSVLQEVVKIYWNEKNVEWFSISSAYPLSPEQRQECEQFLSKFCNKEVRCHYLVSRQLIAGIRMQSDTFLWEHSVYKQLQIARNLFA